MATYRDLVQSYASSTGANLEIKSMISDRVVVFPAFLTNISQDFKSQWNTESVFGRMYPIATFQNTTRTVSLGWNVPAASVTEAKLNHKKFTKLSQMLYPAYFKNTYTSTFNDSVNNKKIDFVFETGNVIMAKSPLVRVKFGNMVCAQDGANGLLGWIDGLSFKPTLSLGMFSAGGGKFYAKNFELSFTLNVLHDEDVGIDANDGKWLGSDSDKFQFGD